MIKQIVQMFESVTKYDYWKEDLYLKPILEIKYYDNEKLEKNDYINQILSICVKKEYTDGVITDNEWKKILHMYFYVLIKNELATSESKYQMLSKYLGELLFFSRSCEDGKLLVEEEVADRKSVV